MIGALKQLETARLRLRPWRERDLDELHRIALLPDVYRYLTGQPPTEDETAAQLDRFRRHWDEHGFGLWAVEERSTGRFVGRIGLAYHRLWPNDPEVGWKLDPAVWGRGYATEGGAASLAYAFETLGVDRVVSIVHPQNVRSIRVMERLGLEPWRQVWWEEQEIMLEVHSKRRAAPPPAARPARAAARTR